jgi:hypothetical protein
MTPVSPSLVRTVRTGQGEHRADRGVPAERGGDVLDDDVDHERAARETVEQGDNPRQTEVPIADRLGDDVTVASRNMRVIQP